MPPPPRRAPEPLARRHGRSDSLSASKRFSPMPSTSLSCSSERKPPLRVAEREDPLGEGGTYAVELVELLGGGGREAERPPALRRRAAPAAGRRHRPAPRRGTTTCCPSSTGAARFTAATSARRDGPPATSSAAATREPSGTRYSPGRRTAPATWT